MKFNKRILVPIAIVVVFVFVWLYFYWYPGYVMDQKIEELQSEGIDLTINDYTKYHEHTTATNPTAVFAEQIDWSSFKQQAMVIKSDEGSVSISVDLDQRIFVLTLDETTHYYYSVF